MLLFADICKEQERLRSETNAVLLSYSHAVHALHAVLKNADAFDVDFELTTLAKDAYRKARLALDEHRRWHG